MKKIIILVITLLLVLAGCSSGEKEEVNIYTSRDYDVDRIIYDQFQEETGIVLNVVELDNEELVTKVIAEKENPTSDVVIVNGAQFISELSEAGVLSNIDNSVIDSNVDEKYYGTNFVGLTTRARIVAYNPESINPSDITNYDDLTKDLYNEEILVRSSTNGYNQAMVMNMVQNKGYDYALNWANGIVNNMARTPEGGDRDQIKGIYAGIGNVAIVNSYYYYQMLNSSDPEEVKAAQSVEVIYPSDSHVNMTWLGTTTSGSENKSVEELITYLTSSKVQQMYYDENYEFPVNSEIAVAQEFTSQPVDFTTLGQFKEDALKIFNESGWE